jgi:hypothetical protein
VNHAQQKRGQIFQDDGLTDNEKNCRPRVGCPVVELKLMQPIPQKMEDEKKIPDDEGGIDPQLDRKCAQGFGGVGFHFISGDRSTIHRRSPVCQLYARA